MSHQGTPTASQNLNFFFSIELLLWQNVFQRQNIQFYIPVLVLVYLKIYTTSTIRIRIYIYGNELNFDFTDKIWFYIKNESCVEYSSGLEVRDRTRAERRGTRCDTHGTTANVTRVASCYHLSACAAAVMGIKRKTFSSPTVPLSPYPYY